MHECPFCGQVCDCDGDDTWLNAPDDCACPCDPDGEDEDDFQDGIAEGHANGRAYDTPESVEKKLGVIPEVVALLRRYFGDGA